ncbi:MAG TPA: tyrosine-type recombinase/integrase, partial [Aeromicrobium sp.]|nr:tyrosine-type recombinase/integrase [Aeromicrobium sp.]
WQARFKIGRVQVDSATRDTKREAEAWLRRQRAAHRDGYDPRLGKVRVSVLLTEWLKMRESAVSSTTYATDQQLSVSKVLPEWFKQMNVNAVTSKHVEQWQSALLARGLTATSVRRYRSSLSPFFGWCVREHYIQVNPVAPVDPPKDWRADLGINPFNEKELADVATDVAKFDQTYATLVTVLGWTGIRWGEARAMPVAGFVHEATPLLLVSRSQTEGNAVKNTKSGKVRRVPLANTALPLVEEFAAGKAPDDLLFTTPSGGQLHRATFIRKTHWTPTAKHPGTGRGRSIHDLRHTAACLWLSKGVPLGTVQAWLGHASIATTNKYLHHLGDYADRVALDLLN